METPNNEYLNSDEQLELLSRLFGSYKAEWLQDSLFDLYSEPSYFPELTTSRPCVLNGGRGTGKTTVLKSLSYLGQWEIQKRKFPDYGEDQLKEEIKKSKYFGFYYRANTYRLAAFQGEELSKEEWQKLFLHYINVLFSIQLVDFLIWFNSNVENTVFFSHDDYSSISSLLGTDKVSSIDELKSQLNKCLIEIETYINNIGLDEKPRLSASGTLDSIFNMLSEISVFKSKPFFLIIDEYENFRDEQQQVINTLIKHTSTSYTFKIGVRKLGWRIKNTLNINEILISPADYVLIDIASKLSQQEFSSFAEEICNSRIKKLFHNSDKHLTVRQLFPELSTDQEAELLGVSEIARELRDEVDKSKNKKLKAFSDQLKDVDLWVIKYLADGKSEDFIHFLEAKSKDNSWRSNTEDYKYASLFSLKARKAGIKKYYAGWGVFTRLSAINIRYLLELVEQTLLLHLKKEESLNKPIPYKTQTLAAQAVGKKNLEELDGLTTYGGMLTKLVLGLGRIFGALASNSGGHAHEVNQFRIREQKYDGSNTFKDIYEQEETHASKILNAAVMHLAILTFPNNKPKVVGETRDDTFQLHPIFAPYFIFSHRKRRNLIIDEDQIIGLIDSPRETIKKVLIENNRTLSTNLPEQLKLFSKYYDI